MLPISSPMRLRAAFTLLELTVVVTIISLLMGGVLLGKNYIRNSELLTTMTDAKFYMLSFNRFQEKYQALPGDFATASSVWSAATNGDGNGLVRAGTSNTAELFTVFNHLARAGYVEGAYDAGGTTLSAGFNVPRGAPDQVSYLFDHPDAADGAVASDSFYFDGFYGHVLYVGRNSSVRPVNGFMTPEEAYALDAKFDDGMPGLGSVLTPKSTALTGCASSDTAASATYSATTYTRSCMFVLKVL